MENADAERIAYVSTCIGHCVLSGREPRDHGVHHGGRYVFRGIVALQSYPVPLPVSQNESLSGTCTARARIAGQVIECFFFCDCHAGTAADSPTIALAA